MRLFIIITMILVNSFSYATVYKWIDEEGQIHYTDKPINDAIAVEFEDNTKNHVSMPPPPSIPNNSPQKPKSIKYQLTITNPVEEETIRNNSGYFTVSTQLNPKAPAQSKLQLYLDNQALGKPQTSSIFTLKNINRGQHSIIIKLLDKNGKIIASSLPRTIFLHRSIKNKPS
ncbi:DUF4124 domain-containing protein [Shewanella surugensis]|uniref:DUF4124 domain-containing protein n=1 Tax=Shewanella surugensis TaxID=212020 RepID=A0ABT0LDH5_9GAMM|nr:DUF4124 domain-containing protein [Shewanella surugensis]MCL1125181.1 DUF4124 domain-containing protein [Shewanella surugensis]